MSDHASAERWVSPTRRLYPAMAKTRPSPTTTRKITKPRVIAHPPGGHDTGTAAPAHQTNCARPASRSRAVVRGERPGDPGRAPERRARIEREGHGDPGHERGEAPLVPEGRDEAAGLQLGPDLRRDPAADVHPAHRQRLERQVAGLRPVDGGEEIERLHADRVAAGERDFGDDRAGIARGELRLEPCGRALRTGFDEEAVDVVQPGPRQHALVAHVAPLTGEEAQELHLLLVPRGEVRVPALRR